MHKLVVVRAESIGQGNLLSAIDEELQIIARDVIERPHIAKKRTLTIKVEIKPDYDHETKINSPEISYELKHGIPGRTGVKSKGLVEGQQLVINHFDVNPNQHNMIDPADVEGSNVQRLKIGNS